MGEAGHRVITPPPPVGVNVEGGRRSEGCRKKKERRQTLITAVVESCWEPREKEEEGKAAEGGVTDTEREEAD